MQVNASRLAPVNEAEVEALLQQMTLAEKIGQMTQPEKNSIPPEDAAIYFIGSVLSGGGGNPTTNSPETWARMVRDFQDAALTTRLGIPLIYGVDAVHGHNNVEGAVIFPHNIGLGAARDSDLVRRIARVTARELIATGVHWDFAPAVSIPQDIRWGRTYEGFSENTDVVTELGTAYVEGLQNADPRVLASVKHFIADGGTRWGSTRTYDWMHGNWQSPQGFKIDQGNNDDNEATLRATYLPPYVSAIEAGALNIMVSFSSWQDVKMHANRYLLTDVVKSELGFKGFLVSDWMAINQIDRDYYTCVVTSINAGLDMIMVPFDYKGFINALTRAVEQGDVSMERIDDAVRRILQAKFWLGLFENPFGRDDFLTEVGSETHREVAREAVRKSLVLLKNDSETLPLSKDARILVAGKGADDIGMQCGGWSISWQGTHGAITPGTSILEGIRKSVNDSTQVIYSVDGTFTDNERAAIGIAVVGESPYAEGIGDSLALRLAEDELDVIDQLRKRCDKLVVILLSGRPMIVTEAAELSDAFVAAWLPGTEGQGVADVLFGDFAFSGKTAYSFPRTEDQIPLRALQQHKDGALFPFGYGLTT